MISLTEKSQVPRSFGDSSPWFPIVRREKLAFRRGFDHSARPNWPWYEISNLPLGIVLIMGILCGCHSEPSSPVNNQATTFPASPEIRVAAEDWSEFVQGPAQQSAGWIAIPPSLDVNPFKSNSDPAAMGIVGPEACRKCHGEIVDSFSETSHALTSRVAASDSMLGKLQSPDNEVQTSVDGFVLSTFAEGDSVLQQVSYHSAREDLTVKFRLAFTVGSGNHGQSFLAWHGDQLCQTPISYLSEAACWGNSPGIYRDGTADFARPATTRCLDCHNTWFGHAPGSVNRYDREQWILGVTCVRCHGPARDHIRYHEAFTDKVDPMYIVNPRSLSRERSNEVCAQCHSGAGEFRRPAFTYKPGERLSDWIDIDLNAASAANDDPHAANQLGRLMRSRCSISSGTLTCIDCHDPHHQERGNQQLFSQRCQKCHEPSACVKWETYKGAIESRCIDCHMPSRRDAAVTSQGLDRAVVPLLRDHLIAVWPDVSRTIEATLLTEKGEAPQ